MADRYEGAHYHILSRGNEQSDIFYDDTDRRLFLGGAFDAHNIIILLSEYVVL
jgi:hypothetical protein